MADSSAEPDADGVVGDIDDDLTVLRFQLDVPPSTLAAVGHPEDAHRMKPLEVDLVMDLLVGLYVGGAIGVWR